MMCTHCGREDGAGHTEQCGYLRALEKLLYETNRFFWSKKTDTGALDRLRAAWVDAEHYHHERSGTNQKT